MDEKRKDQVDRIARYNHMILKRAGKAVRPFRADGYVNLLNRYGTQKDTTERYQFQAEPMVSDELLTMYYEGNRLFAKIIDTPAGLGGDGHDGHPLGSALRRLHRRHAHQ